ncbi:MAG: hypothetical protein AAB867_03230, partial [Patescibacteria group bacterium]
GGFFFIAPSLAVAFHMQEFTVCHYCRLKAAKIQLSGIQGDPDFSDEPRPPPSEFSNELGLRRAVSSRMIDS